MTNDADQGGQYAHGHNLDNHLKVNLLSYVTLINRDMNTIHEKKLLHLVYLNMIYNTKEKYSIIKFMNLFHTEFTS